MEDSLNVLGQIPLWAGGALFYAMLLLAIEIGYRTGCRQRSDGEAAKGSGRNLALNAIFSLLGLILAFTFADGVSHYKARKASVLEETNAIGTAYLRADLLAEPGRSELKTALFEYTRARTPPAQNKYDRNDVKEILRLSEEKLSMVWPVMIQALGESPSGAIDSAVAAAINDVIDSFSVRNHALQDRLPEMVLFLLCFMAAVALSFVGHNAGIAGQISRWRLAILALVFTGVVVVIMDFDRPESGSITVSQEGIRSLLEYMRADLGK